MRSPKPDSVQQSACRFQSIAFHIQLKGQQHIFKRGQRLNQLVRLEHKSNLASAHRGQFPFGEVVNRRSIQPDLALARRIQARKQAQQSALAASAGAHNGHKLASRDAERDPLQNLHPPRAILNPLPDLSNFNHPATPSTPSPVPCSAQIHCSCGRLPHPSRFILASAFGRAIAGRKSAPTGLLRRQHHSGLRTPARAILPRRPAARPE